MSLRLLSFVLALIAFSSSCQAQATFKCGSFDTATSLSTPFFTLGFCNITAGATGNIYASANAENNCNGIETVQMFIGAGSASSTIISGSNFNATIPSAGVLRVSKIVNGFGVGGVNALTFTAGSSGANGTYNAAPMTGSATGAGFTPNVTVAGGVVTAVATIGGFGAGYTVGDVLTPTPGSALATSGLTGFTVTVTGIVNTPWLIKPGQSLQGAEFNKQTATIINQISSALPGGALGMLGDYSVDPTLTVTGPPNNLFALMPYTGGMTAITPALKQSGCNPSFVTTGITGAFVGVPNSPYWLAVVINSDANGNTSTWNNNSLVVMTY